MNMLDAAIQTPQQGTELVLPEGVFGWILTPMDAGIARKGAGWDAGSAPDGSRFFTLTSAGVKDEGSPPAFWCASKDAAWLSFNRHIEAYASGKSRAYFRRKPVLHEEDGKFCVMARVAFA